MYIFLYVNVKTRARVLLAQRRPRELENAYVIEPVNLQRHLVDAGKQLQWFLFAPCIHSTIAIVIIVIYHQSAYIFSDVYIVYRSENVMRGLPIILPRPNSPSLKPSSGYNIWRHSLLLELSARAFSLCNE